MIPIQMLSLNTIDDQNSSVALVYILTISKSTHSYYINVEFAVNCIKMKRDVEEHRANKT